jgi:hypothetical protein
VPAPDPLVAKVESLQNLLVAHATGGGSGAYGDYEELRQELLNNPLTGTGLPRFVHTCRDLSQFWQFIKYKYGHYAERREYIWDEFRPLLELLEAQARGVPVLPSDEQRRCATDWATRTAGAGRACGLRPAMRNSP